MTYRAVQTLGTGALDIVGDVHGEWQALQQLLGHLGYRADGSHPQGRRLVFVGDLCDRGPDSPAVLDWFFRAHSQGFAQAVLGNHELNLLTDDAKDGSGWFFRQRDDKDRQYHPWQTCPNERQQAVKEQLAQLPLVLERRDIRIVHAAWHGETVDRLRRIEADSLLLLHKQWDDALHQELEADGSYAAYLQEQQRYAAEQENPQAPPPPLPATARYDLERCRRHPARMLGSGSEEAADKPFFAAGRWRFTTRSSWWDGYRDDIPVIIGHYWRQWQAGGTKRPLLPPGAAWFGAAGNVFCIDYSAGARWRDRQAVPAVAPAASRFRLAALRWPERSLVFDNGETAATTGFGCRDIARI